jgi:hypothetical protein
VGVGWDVPVPVGARARALESPDHQGPAKAGHYRNQTSASSSFR